MAKTKSKDKSKGGLAVRRVTSKKERQTGGFFMRLKTDEWMKAYALFIPDPEADKNPGYFEYFEHWDNSAKQYVPCAGDDCYMCELGENPSVRALTLWYFPDNEEKEKLKVLKLNGYMIRDFAEIEAEEGGVLGKKFRIKRLSDKGEYRISPLPDKSLPKSEIKSLLKLMDEMKIDFEALTLKQLRAAVAKNDAVDSLTDDDDDDDEDEDEKPKARRGKDKSKKAEPEEDEDDEDEDDDDEDENDDDDDDSDDDDSEDEDDDEEESDEDDEDDDENEDEEEEDDDEEEEAEAETLSGEKFAVVSTNESEETITVKIEGKNTKLWVGEGVTVDFDVVKKGAEITVDAVQDDEGDWVISKLKAKAAAKPKDDKKKGKTTKGKSSKKK